MKAYGFDRSTSRAKKHQRGESRCGKARARRGAREAFDMYEGDENARREALRWAYSVRGAVIAHTIKLPKATW